MSSENIVYYSAYRVGQEDFIYRINELTRLSEEKCNKTVNHCVHLDNSGRVNRIDNLGKSISSQKIGSLPEQDLLLSRQVRLDDVIIKEVCETPLIVYEGRHNIDSVLYALREQKDRFEFLTTGPVEQK